MPSKVVSISNVPQTRVKYGKERNERIRALVKTFCVRGKNNTYVLDRTRFKNQKQAADIATEVLGFKVNPSPIGTAIRKLNGLETSHKPKPTNAPDDRARAMMREEIIAYHAKMWGEKIDLN